MTKHTQTSHQQQSNVDKTATTTNAANDTAQEVKNEVKETTDAVRKELRETGEQLATEAKSAAQQASKQAKSALASQKSEAARQLHGLANSLRQTSVQLRQQDQGAIASYSQEVANKIDHVSDYLEDRNLDDLLHDAQDFARRQPQLFIGGAFTLGLLAARFLRSSDPHRAEWQTQTYQSHQPYSESLPQTRTRSTAVSTTNR